MSPIYHDILVDFGIMSLLMILAQVIRSRTHWLQYVNMPSSVIAGFMGLLGGVQFLHVLPFSLDGKGGIQAGTYPGFLVVMLFATLFLGKSKTTPKVRNLIEHSGDTFFFNLSSMIGQWGFALLFGILVLSPLFPNLHDGFAIFLPAGFIGGYGTAAAVGSVLERAGWDNALSIGYTSATVGTLAAILGGMIIINIGKRKGWTRMVRESEESSTSTQRGFVNEEDQQSLGKETTMPSAIDPLTWHVSLVLGITVLAFYVEQLIASLLPFDVGLPTFCIGLILGAIAQQVLNYLKVGHYINKHVIHRIGSAVTDYLVAFGIASITVHVVLQYALPLTLLFVFGMLFVIFVSLYVGQRICRNFWFERAMVVYGWGVGSVATSVLLLRIIDPDMRTKVIEDFGLAYVGISFFEITIVTLLPVLVANGMIAGPTFVLIVAFFLAIFLSRRLVGWFHYAPDAIRPMEVEIMRGTEDA